MIGVAFIALALYIAAQSTYTLATKLHPHPSIIGIGWLALSACVMFVLAAGKAATGKQMGNRLLQTEARVTVIDGFLAVAILVGLLLNALAGWWWADPLAGLVIVYYGAREGWHALHEA